MAVSPCRQPDALFRRHDIELLQQLGETDIRRALIDDDAHGAVGGMRAHIDHGAGKARVAHRRHGDEQLAVEIADSLRFGGRTTSGHGLRVQPLYGMGIVIAALTQAAAFSSRRPHERVRLCLPRFTSRGKVLAARVAAPRTLGHDIAPAFFPRRFTPAALSFIAGAILGIAVAEAALAAVTSSSPWVASNSSKVRLVSGTVDLDGRPALVAGVQLRMDPGLEDLLEEPRRLRRAAQLRLRGSKNLKQAELLYPAPHQLRRRQRHGDRL